MQTAEQHRVCELARYRRWRQEAIKKLGGKCVKCGSKKNLEFDHVDPKTKSFAISEMWSMAPELLEQELKKCQLLCKEHHKEKTRQEQLEVHGPRRHGTSAMYYRGKCRCQECRNYFNTYRRDLRARKRLSADMVN